MRFVHLFSIGLVALVSACSAPVANNLTHNYLLETQSQVEAMQRELAKDGLFQAAFKKQKADIDAKLSDPVNVPLPADAGGGFTHEMHKRNYANMYKAGRIYTLTQEAKYANYVKDILFAYADMYPSLPLHPQQKEQSPGKLFWQSLNEAMWLVYTIQAYDAIKPSMTLQERDRIEQNVFVPMANYLSDESPQTFNKVHNHGTWATAAVGMSGYVLDKPEWVEKSLYGLDLSGKGGFMRQLDELFSPNGYYNEGPYYQRFALLPFLLFSQAIEINDPQRDIFEYRDQILLKAIDTTLQLSYNGLFFGFNDAIKDKGIDTIELVHGAAIAYAKTKNKGLLSIAKAQNNVLLTGYGLPVVQGIDNNEQIPYPFKSSVFGDGTNGDQGALIVFRKNQATDHQTLVFKATSQGLGHGHFDKLHWMFYNQGKEIVYDYGAARFLNIEAKYGGHYLPENKTYAKQTIAHNTLVVDETSHFNGNTAEGNKHHPELLFNEFDKNLQISSASISTAYDNVTFSRTQAMVNTSKGHVFVVDILNTQSESSHTYDVPVHFIGQFIDTNVALQANVQEQHALGSDNGYQHLWLQATGEVNGDLAKVTWLTDNTFYTHSTVASSDHSLLMTRIGANDPNFNLIANQALINRVEGKGDHEFLSVLEIHGEYNGTAEYTIDSHSQLSSVANISDQIDNDSVTLIRAVFNDNIEYLIAFTKNSVPVTEFVYKGKVHQIIGHAQLIEM
ncbi:MAG: heparinase II/III family protein [Glaciecola sp.]